MTQNQPGQVPPFPGGQPAAPAAKPKKPWFKKWWVWVLAILVPAVVVLLVRRLRAG